MILNSEIFMICSEPALNLTNLWCHISCHFPQSFVESGADIKRVRDAAQKLGHHPIIIAKIERSRVLDNLDHILDTADAIMIARGNLGVEILIEEIAVVQKHIMYEENLKEKPVITATQMLESMTDSRLPTRAEATDVSKAILDGTDCVMLSGESAMGKYPVESSAMLAKIVAVIITNACNLILFNLLINFHARFS
ncbi:MAG: hypothetical protein KJP23_18650 [Deltaproteobacteria bacterium]|nr:hypothetical protein [Deltaproteobacteria bacterium]